VEQRAIVSSAVCHVCGVYGYESVWVVDIMLVILRCPKCHVRREVDYDKWYHTTTQERSEQYVCMSELCGETPMLYHKIAGQR